MSIHVYNALRLVMTSINIRAESYATSHEKEEFFGQYVQ